MTMLGVVPGKECLAVSPGILDAAEAIPEVRTIFKRLEVRFEEEIVEVAPFVLCSADVVILYLRDMDLRAATLKGKVKDAARFYSRYLRTRAMQC
jgi:hypothetical protein